MNQISDTFSISRQVRLDPAFNIITAHKYDISLFCLPGYYSVDYRFEVWSHNWTNSPEFTSEIVSKDNQEFKFDCVEDAREKYQHLCLHAFAGEHTAIQKGVEL